MADYQRDGAVCIRNLFTPEEVALLRDGIVVQACTRWRRVSSSVAFKVAMIKVQRKNSLKKDDANPIELETLRQRVQACTSDQDVADYQRDGAVCIRNRPARDGAGFQVRWGSQWPCSISRQKIH